jgi:ATP-dependent helicase HrpB
LASFEAEGPPIMPLLPAVVEALASAGVAVLEAPPGAGKTTRVPLALLDAPWLDGGRIIMLEPRRLAARAAAGYMASLLGESAGGTVGYRVRNDTRVGRGTRIEVVTEGVLTRMLQADPSLDGVGVLVFDEFHERSVHADLGLALALQARLLLRPELRLLVMSATLDGRPVARLLGGAPVLTSEGRAWPVETHYAAQRPERHVEPAVSRAVLAAVRSGPGDVLVFLPGAAEIARVQALLENEPLPAGTRVLPLFGNLPQSAQDAAIAPSPPGARKIVLATAIAETSLTIEGVRIVVDSGLMRVPRFSPRIGMTRLETVPVTRASADQRRGRAGRLGPGVCYRLWSEHDHAGLAAHGVPEILETDLTPLALELAAWGVHDPAELQWLDPPPAGAFAQAGELLRELGAVDGAGTITPHGLAIAALPLHPRLAHMLIVAGGMNAGGLACDIAALLAERDVLRAPPGGAPDPDLRLRLDALRARGMPAAVGGLIVDRGALATARRDAAELRTRLARTGVRTGGDGGGAGDVDAGALVALAYPDRIGQRRSGGRGRFLLRNGRGATIDGALPLAGESFIAAAELEGRGRESRVYLAAPLERADLDRLFAEDTITERVIEWDDAAGAVRARRVTRLGAIVLGDAALTDASDEELAAALMAGVRRHGLDALPWSETAVRLRARLAFLHAHDGSWPDVSDAALLESLEAWLAPAASGARSRDDLRRVDLAAALAGVLDWRQRARLDELAPTHVEVPSGSRIAIGYDDPASPTLAARLQELFGMHETPRVGNGVPLTIHLLSPARRPVQVTRDLASFWSTTYFDVKKDLKGRYPKHYWPDDPLTAEATRRTRR